MAYTTIKKPSDYFNTKLYTGNSTARSITGVGFAPDFVWLKDRTRVEENCLWDTVRGATKNLISNRTNAESTEAGGLTAFGSDGFSLGSEALTNYNNDEYASWNWKANGAGVANTDGTISSTVSANTTSGFSIVSFTGTGANATVGHGLGVAPKWIIVKSRGVENWRVYSSSLGATKAIRLNGTEAADTDSSYWNGEPTSSVFTVGTNAGTNGSSVNMIAYCFADVQGYSKFGSYVGNGNADGTFVYTGFKPAFILSKNASGIDNWFIQDTTRNTSNPVGAYLRPNLDDAEGSFNHYDILSNGFKNLYAGGSLNASGQTYIYMAFAEQPLVGDNPATAR